MVESSLGIVGACLPSMRPVFVGCSSQGFVRKLREFSYFSSLHSKPSNDQVEFATRASDGDSATTIAHIISAKSFCPGSATKRYGSNLSILRCSIVDTVTSGDYCDVLETDLIDVEKTG